MRLIFLDNQSQRLEHNQFLQGWQWANLQEQLGYEVLKLGIEAGGELIATAFVIKKNIFGFKYFYCPKGPILKKDDQSVWNFFFSEIKKLAEKENVIFLRFEPSNKVVSKDYKIKKTIDIQPKSTLVLDLLKSEEALLAGMKQKCRYNLRLAEKKGVEIIESNDADLFWEIMNETKERDGFRLHSKEHYSKLLNYDQSFIKLFIAYYQDEPIACILVNFFNNTATYLHGGSKNEHRNVMAPYLLQWHAITFAKELGYKNYDFYGIDEKKWPGVTRFKLGFGGQIINYPGTFDLIFNSLYYSIYNFLRRIRRK
ncbi:MAG: peptidoglycan bridge formation glycyltransferase FemA/FemB family protein [bacterium]